MKGFKELQIEDIRNIDDGIQHATLLNIVGASGSTQSPVNFIHERIINDAIANANQIRESHEHSRINAENYALQYVNWGRAIDRYYEKGGWQNGHGNVLTSYYNTRNMNQAFETYQYHWNNFLHYNTQLERADREVDRLKNLFNWN